MKMAKFIMAAAVMASAQASTCGTPSGGPMDNPVETMYGLQYNWTSSMVNFSCVYNINDFKESTDDERFAAAAKAASSNTQGGVVFFPKGSYKFTENLVLPSNVIIRGEPTTSPAKSGTKPGSLAPQTKFECPLFAHQGILSMDPKAENIGVVNIELDACAVMLWPGLTSSTTSWKLKDYWWTATAVTGAGQNKLVLGNLVHDVMYGYPDPDSPSGQMWPWRFSTAIAAYGTNVLVANNQVSKAVTSKKVSVTFSGKSFSNVEFPMDNRYGIDVGQVLLGGVIGHAFSSGTCKQTSAGDGLEPECAPWYFLRGAVIRDNYVYQNGRVGISWSGGGDGKTVGSGTQVVNNHVEVAAGTTCYSVDGKNVAGGSDTNENRFANEAGYASNITGNTAAINRQMTPAGFETVDGEGVLHQAANNCDGFRNLWNDNDLTYGSTGYMAYYKLSSPSNNVITNNKVLSNEFLGCIEGNGGTCGKDNTCKDNSQPCKGF